MFLIHVNKSETVERLANPPALASQPSLRMRGLRYQGQRSTRLLYQLSYLPVLHLHWKLSYLPVLHWIHGFGELVAN